MPLSLSASFAEEIGQRAILFIDVIIDDAVFLL